MAASKIRNRIKAISFDLDNTLAETHFETAVWLKEIPKLYAKKHGLTLSKAKKEVFGAYESVGYPNLDWFDIHKWFKKFKFKEKPEDILGDVRHLIKLFPETIPVLKKLRASGFKLIIVSNAGRPFIEFKVAVDGLEGYFDKIYSCTTDFGSVKHESIFKKVCRDLRIKPSELLHVGDMLDFDYVVPRKAGVRAVFLNREGKRVKKGTLQAKNLKEFARIALRKK